MRIATSIATVLFAIVAIPGSVLFCLGAVMLPSFAFGVDDFETYTSSEWMSRITRGALAHVDSMTALVFVLLLSVVVVIGGSNGRSSVLKWTGLICGSMFAVTLLFVGVAGRAELVEFTERAAVATPVVRPHETTPTPAPTTPPLTVEDVRTRIYEMVGVTLDASGPAFGADGQMVIPESVGISASACEEFGSGLFAELSMKTSDNAAAMTRILAAWDKAGFSPDRAIQVDIRYSETDPVKVMTVRDKTTIDGLIHLSIEGRCAVP